VITIENVAISTVLPGEVAPPLLRL